ncbi:hypothetical protein SUGI_0769750 [Cryptomeria japonica]|nr:hypothetical protein SUGI_0769750 [Cryptomeria japonica]
MLGDFTERLSIPPAFDSQFIYEREQHMVLQGPSGQEWDVQLLGANTTLEFRHGWENFVHYHGLKLGDFVVFKYISKLCLKVQIFEKSGCHSSKKYGHLLSSQKHIAMEIAAPFEGPSSGNWRSMDKSGEGHQRFLDHRHFGQGPRQKFIPNHLKGLPNKRSIELGGKPSYAKVMKFSSVNEGIRASRLNTGEKMRDKHSNSNLLELSSSHQRGDKVRESSTSGKDDKVSENQTGSDLGGGSS